MKPISSFLYINIHIEYETKAYDKLGKIKIIITNITEKKLSIKISKTNNWQNKKI